MSLSFLTPGTAVVARSPLRDTLAAQGARFETRKGWEVCMSFGDDAGERHAVTASVAWADVSHLRKRELRDGPFEPSVAVADADGLLCGWTPSRALWIGEDADHAGLDVTTQYVAIRLAGPGARETIARFCALDLRPHVAPPLAFLPGSVARTPGAVLVEAPDRFLLLLGAAYAQFAWTVVSDAGSGLGGCAVGSAAIAVEAHA